LNIEQLNIELRSFEELKIEPFEVELGRAKSKKRAERTPGPLKIAAN
jgi:hypothetical protein